MRVLLADDHELVRNGIASLLKANNIEVAGEASDGLEALEKARDLKPDVILMDIKMPHCSGLEATRLIKTEMPQIKIVILTVSAEDKDLFEAVKSGAEGYILKNIMAKEFIGLLSGVVNEKAALSPTMAAKIMEEFARQNTASAGGVPESNLTHRETSILRLVAAGALNKQIAVEIGISENTVKYHLRNIMSKLHLHNKAQLAAYAVSKGITPSPS